MKNAGLTTRSKIRQIRNHSLSSQIDIRALKIRHHVLDGAPLFKHSYHLMPHCHIGFEEWQNYDLVRAKNFFVPEVSISDLIKTLEVDSNNATDFCADSKKLYYQQLAPFLHRLVFSLKEKAVGYFDADVIGTTVSGLVNGSGGNGFKLNPLIELLEIIGNLLDKEKKEYELMIQATIMLMQSLVSYYKSREILYRISTKLESISNRHLFEEGPKAILKEKTIFEEFQKKLVEFLFKYKRNAALVKIAHTLFYFEVKIEPAYICFFDDVLKELPYPGISMGDMAGYMGHLEHHFTHHTSYEIYRTLFSDDVLMNNTRLAIETRINILNELYEMSLEGIAIGQDTLVLALFNKSRREKAHAFNLIIQLNDQKKLTPYNLYRLSIIKDAFFPDMKPQIDSLLTKSANNEIFPKFYKHENVYVLLDNKNTETSAKENYIYVFYELQETMLAHKLLLREDGELKPCTLPYLIEDEYFQIIASEKVGNNWRYTEKTLDWLSESLVKQINTSLSRFQTDKLFCFLRLLEPIWEAKSPFSMGIV
jgi:hypothetical protein